MSAPQRLQAPGPYTADQIRPGDPYELSNGHRILCLPTGQRGGRSNLAGGQVLETDPTVKSAGIDVGYSGNPGHLRAPDISVGNVEDAPGWATKAPPLAVEYADQGQDEADLKLKIRELFDGGTKHIWVVRLQGPRRVEVHEPNKPMRLAKYGDVLIAPGILQNPVPVEAMFDREAAHEATLRNLLQRKGFASLEAIREEGKQEGKLEGRLDSLYQILSARGIALTAAQHKKIGAANDLAQVDAWIAKALVVTTAKDLFKDPPKSRS